VLIFAGFQLFIMSYTLINYPPVSTLAVSLSLQIWHVPRADFHPMGNQSFV